jgi:predicted component of type VI protein secretion system
MADERPYSLLIRLGVILAPILAGALVWSYYHPPASVLSRKPAPAMPPLAASAPNPSELAADPADAVANPAPPAAAVTMPATSADRSAPAPGGLRSVATGSPTATTKPGAVASTAATTPPIPGPPQQTAPGGERRKPRDIRKQEASSAHRAIQKMDREIDRKLSICSGC